MAPALYPRHVTSGGWCYTVTCMPIYRHARWYLFHVLRKWVDGVWGWLGRPFFSLTRSNDTEPCRWHVMLLLIAYVSDKLQWHQVGNAIPIFLNVGKKKKKQFLIFWVGMQIWVFSNYSKILFLGNYLSKCYKSHAIFLSGPIIFVFFIILKFLLSYIYFVSVYKFHTTSKEAIVVYKIWNLISL